MQTTFRNRQGQPTSFRRELQAQATHLRRVILHQEPYAPFEFQVGGPHDDIAQRDKPAQTLLKSKRKSDICLSSKDKGKPASALTSKTPK